MVVNRQVILVALQEMAKVKLHARPNVSEEEESEPKPKAPAINNLVNAVRPKHEATDSDPKHHECGNEHSESLSPRVLCELKPFELIS